MSMAAATQLEIAPSRPLLLRLALATACAGLADWLFYGWPVGISLALFLAVLGVMAIAGNGVHASRRLGIAMTGVFVAGLIALIDDVDILSMTWSTLATLLFVSVATADKASSWQWHLLDAATTPLRGPFQLVGDLIGASRNHEQQPPQHRRIDSLIAWVVPLVAFAVFLGLFASANPLIDYLLKQITPRMLLNAIGLPRILFWLLVIAGIWPLILRRSRKPSTADPHAAIAAAPSEPGHLFGVQAVSRSMILCNALFGLQTVLDLAYLWGGATLPAGMSHAEYAHRGAYPLVVTALLAAGFVLIAMRPGGPAEKSGLIRPLVLLWTGQNILLVISSMLRLDHYVAAYSLTYLRLAAFIWMVLVAAGLLLMLIQIVRKMPNSWLLAANAAMLALVLYGCCFVNAPKLIASYNIEHSRELGGTGPSIDLQYLASLGPQALPAVEAHVKQVPALSPMASDYRHFSETQMRQRNWRAWGIRTWRLERYLANNPAKSPDFSADDGG